ncbi:hypothetical protein RTBOTA2_000928 [Rhodotorula toruloides]|nr:hypothetical protein RTBOTA2_000928 [Rhodotorula toruloides]
MPSSKGRLKPDKSPPTVYRRVAHHHHQRAEDDANAELREPKEGHEGWFGRLLGKGGQHHRHHHRQHQEREKERRESKDEDEVDRDNRSRKRRDSVVDAPDATDRSAGRDEPSEPAFEPRSETSERTGNGRASLPPQDSDGEATDVMTDSDHDSPSATLPAPPQATPTSTVSATFARPAPPPATYAAAPSPSAFQTSTRPTYTPSYPPAAYAPRAAAPPVAYPQPPPPSFARPASASPPISTAQQQQADLSFIASHPAPAPHVWAQQRATPSTGRAFERRAKPSDQGLPGAFAGGWSSALASSPPTMSSSAPSRPPSQIPPSYPQAMPYTLIAATSSPPPRLPLPGAFVPRVSSAPPAAPSAAYPPIQPPNSAYQGTPRQPYLPGTFGYPASPPVSFATPQAYGQPQPGAPYSVPAPVPSYSPSSSPLSPTPYMPSHPESPTSSPPYSPVDSPVNYAARPDPRFTPTAAQVAAPSLLPQGFAYAQQPVAATRPDAAASFAYPTSNYPPPAAPGSGASQAFEPVAASSQTPTNSYETRSDPPSPRSLAAAPPAASAFEPQSSSVAGAAPSYPSSTPADDPPDDRFLPQPSSSAAPSSRPPPSQDQPAHMPSSSVADSDADGVASDDDAFAPKSETLSRSAARPAAAGADDASDEADSFDARRPRQGEGQGDRGGLGQDEQSGDAFQPRSARSDDGYDSAPDGQVTQTPRVDDDRSAGPYEPRERVRDSSDLSTGEAGNSRQSSPDDPDSQPDTAYRGSDADVISSLKKTTAATLSFLAPDLATLIPAGLILTTKTRMISEPVVRERDERRMMRWTTSRVAEMWKTTSALPRQPEDGRKTTSVAAAAAAGAGLGGAAGYAAAGGFHKDDGDREGGDTDIERDSDARNVPRDDEYSAARQGGADNGRDAFELASRRSRDEDDRDDQLPPDQPADDAYAQDQRDPRGVANDASAGDRDDFADSAHGVGPDASFDDGAGSRSGGRDQDSGRAGDFGGARDDFSDPGDDFAKGGRSTDNGRMDDAGGQDSFAGGQDGSAGGQNDYRDQNDFPKDNLAGGQDNYRDQNDFSKDDMSGGSGCDGGGSGFGGGGSGFGGGGSGFGGGRDDDFGQSGSAGDQGDYGGRNGAANDDWGGQGSYGGGADASRDRNDDFRDRDGLAAGGDDFGRDRDRDAWGQDDFRDRDAQGDDWRDQADDDWRRRDDDEYEDEDRDRRHRRTHRRRSEEGEEEAVGRALYVTCSISRAPGISNRTQTRENYEWTTPSFAISKCERDLRSELEAARTRSRHFAPKLYEQVKSQLADVHALQDRHHQHLHRKHRNELDNPSASREEKGVAAANAHYVAVHELHSARLAQAHARRHLEDCEEHGSDADIEEARDRLDQADERVRRAEDQLAESEEAAHDSAAALPSQHHLKVAEKKVDDAQEELDHLENSGAPPEEIREARQRLAAAQKEERHARAAHEADAGQTKHQDESPDSPKSPPEEHAAAVAAVAQARRHAERHPNDPKARRHLAAAEKELHHISPPNTTGFAPTLTLEPKTSKKRIAVITSLRFTRLLAAVKVYPTLSRDSTKPRGARLMTMLASPICAIRFSSTETHLRRQKGRKRRFGTVSTLHTDFRQLRQRTSMPSRPSTVVKLNSTISGIKALRRLSSSTQKSAYVVPKIMPRRRLAMSRCSLHVTRAISMVTGLSVRRSPTTSISVPKRSTTKRIRVARTEFRLRRVRRRARKLHSPTLERRTPQPKKHIERIRLRRTSDDYEQPGIAFISRKNTMARLAPKSSISGTRRLSKKRSGGWKVSMNAPRRRSGEKRSVLTMMRCDGITTSGMTF